MKPGAERKRIGLMLASVSVGVSKKSWKDFVRVAALENAGLFIFPGGRLNAGRDFENLRNHVYKLANGENLDGCIVWSSTIRYGQSKEEFERFHAGLNPLPYVTVAFKSPGHPCVDFDSYKGMKALVTHCVRRHGAKKIAFLRGPDFHRAARMRFDGYRDALLEAGLMGAKEARGEAPLPLVTDPFDWESGYAAAEQLLRGRSLVPGRDFDTLVGCSDMMTLEATDYFARHGYHIPGDYRATGFNNSEESRVAECPLSTVQHPDIRMADKTFEILLRMLDGKRPEPEGGSGGVDVLLDSEVIIRESCGCTDLYGVSGKAPETPSSPGDGDEREALRKLAGDRLGTYPSVLNALVGPVVDALFDADAPEFMAAFEKALVGFFARDGETENLLRLIDDVKSGGYRVSGRVREMEAALYRGVIKIRERFSVRAGFEKDRCNRILNTLKCDLLGAGDRFSLIQTLAWHLPRMGIDTAAVVLYENEKTSVFVGGFSPEGTSPVREQRFPAALIVPEGLRESFGDGVFMVQPLFVENQSLGYLVHNFSSGDGVIFEELRFSVSYGLKGVLHAEETARVRRVVERTERAKAEFLRVLEDGLSASPFRTEAEAGSVMDFVLTGTDGVSLRKTIFDMEELLPGIGGFPLLSGDPSRLAQCFSLVAEKYPPPPDSPGAGRFAEMTHAGLAVTFLGSPSGDPTEGPDGGPDRAEKVRQFGLLLAERIALMHGGDLSVSADRCTVTLPWTTLCGHEPCGNAVSSGDRVLVLSGPDSLPPGFFDLPQVFDVDKARPGDLAFIAWNAAAGGTGDLVKIAGLRHRSEFENVPFLCYGMPAGGREKAGSASTLMDIVELALSPLKKGNVLFVGPREFWTEKTELFAPSDGDWGTENRPDKVRIDSMSNFNDAVSETSPLLIVFDRLDIKAAAAVRRHPLTVTVPVVMVGDRVDSPADVFALSRHPRLIICHRALLSSADFLKRVRELTEGGDVLPQHTGALVKKTILYFDQNAGSYISRWKLADTVNVSEDYLSRIFHREMGLPLWDYLNRLRIFLAAELLLQTDGSIQTIALQTGFQDQSYFCRIFKKIYGVPPGQFRRN